MACQYFSGHSLSRGDNRHAFTMVHSNGQGHKRDVRKGIRRRKELFAELRKEGEGGGLCLPNITVGRT